MGPDVPVRVALSPRFDAPLFSVLTRIFVRTILAFYTKRMKGISRGQSGAVVALQRTSSDLRLNPHLHVLFLDGVYREEGEHVVFHALPHLSTREVGAALEDAVRRIARYLARRGLLRDDDTKDGGAKSRDADKESEHEHEPTIAQGHAALCASAASGKSPPAGPELRRKAAPLGLLAGKPLQFDKPLCASLDGFTLHAATRAGGLDARAREALLKYVLRPPIAQERVTQGPDGLVRIALKRPFADGTIAIDLDPLSLLCRLAASVPAKGTHTVRYAGVLASASSLRPRIVPKPPVAAADDASEAKPKARPSSPSGTRASESSSRLSVRVASRRIARTSKSAFDTLPPSRISRTRRCHRGRRFQRERNSHNARYVNHPPPPASSPVEPTLSFSPKKAAKKKAGKITRRRQP